MWTLMHEVSFFTAVGNCGGNCFASMEGFSGTSENALLYEGDSTTRNTFGMPAQIIAASKYTGSDNCFTCTSGTDFDGVTITNKRSDIGRDFLDGVTDLHGGKGRAKFFRPREFDKIIDFTHMNEIIST